MNLREIQASWNALVPIAITRGVEAQIWAVPPQTRDRGMRRLNWLRQQLGIIVPSTDQVEFEHNPGAALPPIREIADQYNALVPEAQRRGIRNARPWSGLPSTSLRGMQRLQWLRRQLGHTVSTVAIVAVVEGIDAFNVLTFGIEIECKLPRTFNKYMLSDAFIAAGLQCCVEPYNHAPRGHWKITTDGSLGDYTYGIEVVSPVLNGTDGFSQLRKACKVLTEKKCKVTAKCGLHVHVGWKNGSRTNPLWNAGTLRQIIKLYNRFEPVIDSLLDASRRGGACNFCGSNRYNTNNHHLETAQTWEQVCLAIGQNPNPGFSRNGDRYRNVNLKPIGVYGTVEFRQHHGTVKSTEVENWLRFVLRLVLTAKQQVEWPQSEVSFEEFKKIIALDSSEAEHFQHRLAANAARLARPRRQSRRRRTGLDRLYRQLQGTGE